MSALAKALHPWTCNWSHPDTDGGWLCNRAAADLEAQGLVGSRHLDFCAGGEFCTLDDCLCECHVMPLASRHA